MGVTLFWETSLRTYAVGRENPRFYVMASRHPERSGPQGREVEGDGEAISYAVRENGSGGFGSAPPPPQLHETGGTA